MRTYKEIMAISTDALSVELGNGLKIEASCYTDDPEVLEWPAEFSIRPNWNDEIGMFDNHHGELDSSLMELADKISAVYGGKWVLDGYQGFVEQE